MRGKLRENMPRLIDHIVEGDLSRLGLSFQGEYKFPSKEVIVSITRKLITIIFPGYFDDENIDAETFSCYISELVLSIEEPFVNQIFLALSHSYRNGGEMPSKAVFREKAEDIYIAFFRAFANIREIIETDIQAAFDGDPAATDKDLIIASYPGVFAVTVYRIAHILQQLDVPYIPRMMTEYAHGKTGIDIHPGAEIGKQFFIDHGTGVVIGETTVIGNDVKIYQGVTLGALSTKGGQNLRGVKRHPTIGNNVTIYSGASILGGETVIGDGVVIGGNSFITKSISKG